MDNSIPIISRAQARETARQKTKTKPSKKQNPKNPKKNFLQNFLGFIGELFITLGLVLILFVVWELWWTNLEANRTQNNIMNTLLEDWQFSTNQNAADNEYFGEPIVMPETTRLTESIGIMYIPRFGENYARPIMQGTDERLVLDTLGIGRYDDTAMPGGIGNFAVAGHRDTRGEVFNQIAELRPGDNIYVQTKDGWYRYIYRNQQIVTPVTIGVLNPVPLKNNLTPKDRILTLTSCNPRLSSAERFIAYAVFESWRPATAGPPTEIANKVAQIAQNGF